MGQFAVSLSFWRISVSHLCVAVKSSLLVGVLTAAFCDLPLLVLHVLIFRPSGLPLCGWSIYDVTASTANRHEAADSNFVSYLAFRDEDRIAALLCCGIDSLVTAASRYVRLGAQSLGANLGYYQPYRGFIVHGSWIFHHNSPEKLQWPQLQQLSPLMPTDWESDHVAISLFASAC